jgi:hypothetical protein
MDKSVLLREEYQLLLVLHVCRVCPDFWWHMCPAHSTALTKYTRQSTEQVDRCVQCNIMTLLVEHLLVGMTVNGYSAQREADVNCVGSLTLSAHMTATDLRVLSQC